MQSDRCKLTAIAASLREGMKELLLVFRNCFPVFNSVVIAGTVFSVFDSVLNKSLVFRH